MRQRKMNFVVRCLASRTSGGLGHEEDVAAFCDPSCAQCRQCHGSGLAGNGPNLRGPTPTTSGIQLVDRLQWEAISEALGREPNTLSTIRLPLNASPSPRWRSSVAASSAASTNGTAWFLGWGALLHRPTSSKTETTVPKRPTLPSAWMADRHRHWEAWLRLGPHHALRQGRLGWRETERPGNQPNQ